MTIQCAERDTYEQMWAVPGYAEHSPGEAYAPMFMAMAQPGTRDHILDAGCGTGRGAMALRTAGFSKLTLCDLTDAGLGDDARTLPFKPCCLWDPIAPQLGYLFGGRVDWVYCCDVLEHVPKEFTMLVIARLLEVARRGVFLSIAFAPDVFGALVGKPLHQTVESFVWWRDRLASFGTVKEARDLLVAGVYVVEPK